MKTKSETNTKTKADVRVEPPFKKYFVYRYLPHNGTEYQKGDEIELTQKQARFHILNGFIGKSKNPSKPIREPEQKSTKSE